VQQEKEDAAKKYFSKLVASSGASLSASLHPSTNSSDRPALIGCMSRTRTRSHTQSQDKRRTCCVLRESEPLRWATCRQ
jgi:hypothetical protein